MLKVIFQYLGLFPIFFTVVYAQETGFAPNRSDRIARKEVKSHLATAQEFFYNQQYQATIDLTLKITAQYPDYHEAYFLRGMAREKLGDPTGALVDYEVALHLQPQWAEAKFKRALLLFSSEKYTRAMHDFHDLLQQEGAETQAVFFKGQQTNGHFQTEGITTMQSEVQAELYNYLGLSSMHLDQLIKALSYFDTALLINPNYPDGLNNRGILKEKLSDTTGALQDYQRALQLQPNHENAFRNLTYLARKSNRQEILTAVVTQAVATEASAVTYFQRGLLWLEQGQYQEALNDFDQALVLDSRIPDYYLQRGFVKERLNKLQGALQDYSVALQLNPRLEKAYTNRGNVYFKMEEVKKAIEDYNYALQLNATNEKVYFNRGLAYHKLKNDTASCQDLQKALDLGYQPAQKALDAYCKAKQ